MPIAQTLNPQATRSVAKEVEVADVSVRRKRKRKIGIRENLAP